MLEQTCSSHACTIQFFQEMFFSNKASPINNLDKLHFVRNVLIGQWLALVRIRLFKCSSYNYVLVEQEHSLRQIKVGEYFKRAVSWCFCLFLSFNQPLCWYKCLGPSDVIVTQETLILAFVSLTFFWTLIEIVMWVRFTIVEHHLEKNAKDSNQILFQIVF